MTSDDYLFNAYLAGQVIEDPTLWGNCMFFDRDTGKTNVTSAVYAELEQRLKIYEIDRLNQNLIKTFLEDNNG